MHIWQSINCNKILCLHALFLHLPIDYKKYISYSIVLLSTLYLQACNTYSIPEQEILPTPVVIHPLIDQEDLFTEFTNPSEQDSFSGAWTLSWHSESGIKTDTWFLEDLKTSINITDCYGKTMPVDMQYQQVHWENSRLTEPTEEFNLNDQHDSIVEQKFFINFINDNNLDGSESRFNKKIKNIFTIRGKKVSNRLSPIDSGLLEIMTDHTTSRHSHICGSIKTKLSENRSTTIVKIETLPLTQKNPNNTQFIDPQIIIILSNPEQLTPGYYRVQDVIEKDPSFTFMIDAVNIDSLLKIQSGMLHIEKSTKYQFHATLTNGSTGLNNNISLTIKVNFLNYEEQANPLYTEQNSP